PRRLAHPRALRHTRPPPASLEDYPAMNAIMLKAKLHRAIVTHAVLDYEGACAIDGDWLDMSGIREYEQIQIYNEDTGARFPTYAIRGEAGSRIISVNGAAAHKADVGHRLIICAYAHYAESELDDHAPRVLYMGADGALSHTSNAIPVQLARGRPPVGRGKPQ